MVRSLRTHSPNNLPHKTDSDYKGQSKEGRGAKTLQVTVSSALAVSAGSSAGNSLKPLG